MIKMIALLARKPGISPTDFKSYYETNHVPLISSIATTMLEYRRNYIDFSTILTGGISGAPGVPWAPDFDVITEIWYTGPADFEYAKAEFLRPENARRIAEDEEKFLNRQTKRLFMVDEQGAVISA